MKPLRVLMITQRDLVPPEVVVDDDDAIERSKWKTDYDVREGLRALGHDVSIIGEDEDLADVRAAIDELKPHIVFNLLEFFANRARFLPHILGYLELIGQAYTGCNPVGMTFSVDKALQRKILRHHRIATPEYAPAPMRRTFRRPARLTFPLIVKSAHEHGSQGISQASVVTSDEKLLERIDFIHNSIGTHAIVEQYVEGRELYVGIVGNQRLEAFPIWEMSFDNLPDSAANIATYKLKWDLEYQDRVGLTTGSAKDLDDDTRARVVRTCKRAYRSLEQSGYARFDLRLHDDGRLFVIESNPNPDLSYHSEFPQSARAGGYTYERLLQRIVTLGLSWKRRLRDHP